jgi:hypothetical protein
MKRELKIVVESDGTLVCDSATSETLKLESHRDTAETYERRRASDVEPAAWPLRLLFHLCRLSFGESGKMAEWTRHWACVWRVNMRRSNGPILDERYLDRRLAIDAERRWLSENNFGRKR